MKIGDFEATLTHARVGDTSVALWRLAALERHVNRVAVLAADEAPEPPYWAHLWRPCEESVREEDLPLTVKLVEVARRC